MANKETLPWATLKRPNPIRDLKHGIKEQMYPRRIPAEKRRQEFEDLIAGH